MNIQNNIDTDKLLREVYNEIRLFLMIHLDFWEEVYYDIFTSWIISTWLIDKFYEIAYLLFLGPQKSGKTTALKIAHILCYNPILAAVISTSAIYRTLSEKTTTFLIDEFEQYKNERLAVMMAILNAGYTRDLKAIICVPKGNDWEVKHLPVFGPKAIASTKMPKGPFASRLIIISMIKNSRPVNFRIDKEKAREIVKKLTLLKNMMKDVDIGKTEEILFNIGIKDYRLVQLFCNLIVCTPKDSKGRIIEYVKTNDKQITEEESFELYGETFEAIEKCLENPIRPGCVQIYRITDHINTNRPEGEKLSPRFIGSILSTMGLTRKCRYNDGRIGRYITEYQFKRLRKRYKSECPEHSEDTTYRANLTSLHRASSIKGESAETPITALCSEHSDIQISLEAQKLIHTAEKVLYDAGDEMGTLGFLDEMSRHGYNERDIRRILSIPGSSIEIGTVTTKLKKQFK